MVLKEEFISRLTQKYSEKINNIEILDYNGIGKKVTYKCKNCGNIESLIGTSILKRHSESLCKECDNPLSYRRKEQQNQQQIQKMFEKSDNTLHFINTELDKSGDHNHLVVVYFCDRCQQMSKVFLKDKTNQTFTCRHCGPMARMTPDDFQIWFKLYYDDKFELLDKDSYQGTNCRVHIKCKECGFITYPNTSTLKRKHKVICPKCRHGKSRQEIYIGDWLSKNNVDFDSEVNFKWLPDSHMRYDFVIFSKKIIIEYDGEQHFEFVPHFHKNYKRFEQLQLNDKIKTELALEHGFSILRIPYFYKDKIKDILIHLFGSTTIPTGSRGKRLEIDSILNEDEDIVSSYMKV